MRVERPSILCRWFQHVFPTVAPRVAVVPAGRCCYAVCPPKAVEAPRFAYWNYLERQNTIDANVEPGLPLGPGLFKPVRPAQVMYEPVPCHSSGATPSVGLGGPSLGFVPPATDVHAAPPQRAPVRTVRVYEPGVHATAMDIIA